MLKKKIQRNFQESTFFYMIWYGIVWYGMVYYGMAWHGTGWHGTARCNITNAIRDVSLWHWISVLCSMKSITNSKNVYFRWNSQLLVHFYFFRLPPCQFELKELIQTSLSDIVLHILLFIHTLMPFLTCIYLYNNWFMFKTYLFSEA